MKELDNYLKLYKNYPLKISQSGGKGFYAPGKVYLNNKTIDQIIKLLEELKGEKNDASATINDKIVDYVDKGKYKNNVDKISVYELKFWKYILDTIIPTATDLTNTEVLKVLFFDTIKADLTTVKSKGDEPDQNGSQTIKDIRSIDKTIPDPDAGPDLTGKIVELSLDSSGLRRFAKLTKKLDDGSYEFVEITLEKRGGNRNRFSQRGGAPDEYVEIMLNGVLTKVKVTDLTEEQAREIMIQERTPRIDSGDADIQTYNVKVFKSMGKNGDTLLGSTSVHRSQTIKSVLDSIKGGSSSQRCVITSYHNFVNSIGPKDYYVTLSNLRLKNPQLELYLI
jgi:hypothetical protein